MGKDVGFYISSRLNGSDLKSENQVSHLPIINIWSMSRPQNRSKMIQNTVFMAHKDTANLSTKNPFRRQPQLILQMSEDEGWCPWDRLDDSHDDAFSLDFMLATASVVLVIIGDCFISHV